MCSVSGGFVSWVMQRMKSRGSSSRKRLNSWSTLVRLLLLSTKCTIVLISLSLESPFTRSSQRNALYTSTKSNASASRINSCIPMSRLTFRYSSILTHRSTMIRASTTQKKSLWPTTSTLQQTNPSLTYSKKKSKSIRKRRKFCSRKGENLKRKV